MTFKLALLQAALFAVSAATLFAAVYLGVVDYATAQIKASVAAEAAVLAEEGASDGIPELISTLQQRARDRESDGRAYLLRAGDGQLLAGTLQSASGLGWQTIPASEPGDAEERGNQNRTLIVYGQRLRGGELLLVGHDLRDVDEIGHRLVRIFCWAAGVTLMLAILGGVLTSFAALRRVETINATARQIMTGDLSGRVAVRGSQDEFDRLAVNLNEMLDRIEHLMDGLRQVSSDIAHDLRTPLTHLRQRLDAARAGEPSLGAYEAVMDAIAGDVDRILRIFAALLRIAQVEAGTRRGAFVDLDLSGIFASILDVYAPVAEDAGQEMTGTLEDNLRIMGDHELLTQLLANLVENAIRHAGSAARIQLDLHREGDDIRGSVSDTGPGIPLAAYAKVFHRFHRLAPDRGSSGHGLGLSLVKAVVELHGGRIALADNQPGLRVEFAFAVRPVTR